MRLLLKHLVLLLAVCGVNAPSNAEDMATSAGFQAHKATYEISTKKVQSGSPIINVTGTMDYSWSVDCEGWLSRHKFDLTYEYTENPSVKSVSEFSTFERFDTKQFSFISQRKRNGAVSENTRGYAKRNNDGKGEVLFTKPPELSFDLPNNTQFPMQHTLSVLQSIKNNKKFYNAMIFDGSDKDGPVEVNAFIGKPLKPRTQTKGREIDNSLLQSTARTVRLAFFPLKDQSATSSYEMDIVFHENGVISDMMVDYSDFTVRQKLIALETVPSTCDTIKQ